MNADKIQLQLSTPASDGGIDLEGERELTIAEQEILSWTNNFVEEYRDVFEALSK